MSDNKRAWWDNATPTGSATGPTDRSEDYAAEVPRRRSRPRWATTVIDLNQGGEFCVAEKL